MSTVAALDDENSPVASPVGKTPIDAAAAVAGSSKAPPRRVPRNAARKAVSRLRTADLDNESPGSPGRFASPTVSSSGKQRRAV